MIKDCKILFVAYSLCQNINIILTLRVYLGFVHITFPFSKNIFTDVSEVALLLWIIYVISVFFMLACTPVCLCLVVTCWERADPLALVCDV